MVVNVCSGIWGRAQEQKQQFHSSFALVDYFPRQDCNGVYGQWVSPALCLMSACVLATVHERAEGVREGKIDRELYCRETWIMLWTVYAAVAAAVFEIALNSQRLCGMNEWMNAWMNEWQHDLQNNHAASRKRQCRNILKLYTLLLKEKNPTKTDFQILIWNVSSSLFRECNIT